MKTCPQCETGYPDSQTACPTHGHLLNEIRELRPGLVIHKTYRIVRKLGQGGMGTVYLAQHIHMGEHRALKFLSHELSCDQALTSRFLREVRTLRQVHSRNVVDCGDLEAAEDDSLFFSMEFVDGPDLRAFLRDAHQPFDVGLALSITRSIAEGLGAAHSKGMVHRDIKPENILMAREAAAWLPKIADFGIVATKESSTAYTRTGGTLLTMNYAAPEQWRGTPAASLDGRTDLYALGGLLYEMLTGQTPFHAENYEGWARQHQTTPPQPPSTLRPDLVNWQGLDALTLRLLAKDREDRPKDVAELVALLDAMRLIPSEVHRETVREVKAANVIQASAENSPKPETRSGSRWVVAAVVMILVGLLVFVLLRSKSSNEPTERPQIDPRTGDRIATPQSKYTIEDAPSSSPGTTTPDQKPTATKPDKWEQYVVAWTDPDTGLMWAKKDNGSDVNWKKATNYCQNVMDNHTDWRLPTIDELQGIYDANANVNGYHVKGNLQLSGWPWSSSQGDTSGQAWFFDFKYGGRESRFLNTFGYKRALCVRGSANQSGNSAVKLAPAVPAIIRGDGAEAEALIWTDPAAGLMWTKKDNGSDVNWQQATDYCRKLQLAGHSNWRLPTIDELQGIYDANVDVGGWHVKGKLQLSGWDWSSSQDEASEEAWVFFFTRGMRGSAPLRVFSGERALCVRPSGQ